MTHTNFPTYQRRFVLEPGNVWPVDLRAIGVSVPVELTNHDSPSLTTSPRFLTVTAHTQYSLDRATDDVETYCRTHGLQVELRK